MIVVQVGQNNMGDVHGPHPCLHQAPVSSRPVIEENDIAIDMKQVAR